MVEGVEMFSYPGITLEKTDDDWPSVRRNIMHTRLVLGRLGTLLRRKIVDHLVAEMFYRVVVQAILLYGSETWVHSMEIEKKV